MAALALLTQVAGCTLAGSPQPSPQPSAVSSTDVARLSELASALENRDRSLESMQTGAIMEYRAGDQHVKAREQIVALRPASLRVEAMSPFGVALVLAARDSRLQIFEPSENKFMHGTASADTLNRFVRIPMAPADAVGLLMGIAPAPFSANAASINSDGEMMIAAYRSSDASMRELGFSDGQLAMVRETGSDGRIKYDVRYTDYRDIGGVMFPYVVDADFPAAQSHVTFRYQRPIINGATPASLFVLTPGPNAAQIDLGFLSDATLHAS